MKRPHSLIAAALLPATIALTCRADSLDQSHPSDHSNIAEVVVTADLRATKQLDLPASVSIYNKVDLDRQAISHLEQVLAQAPNINFASGASRGRFIQIRGIGERGEFIEPVNFSVGVLMDGIDFTGISTAVTSLDVEQIEVLRGPQGTTYGANALAGLINVKSNSVAEDFSAQINGQFGEYDTANLSGHINLPLTSTVGARLAVQQNKSDGYRDNAFLNRDDTNEIDETNLRTNIQWQANDALTLNWIGFYADVDNGYDGFSLNNTEDTFSDQPGRDAQETVASAIKSQYQFANGSQLIASLSFADSDIEYSYDEDWVFVGICENTACDSDLWGFDWEYSSFDRYLRDNQNTTADIRFVTALGQQTQWVSGLYFREQEVDLERIYTFADNNFTSRYETENAAIYAEMEHQLSDALSLTVGARWETRDADYRDNDNVRLSSDENAWGGKLAVKYKFDNQRSVYGLVARGYQFGNFNPNNAIAPEFRQYDAEYLNNYEIGFKGAFAQGRVFTQVALFWQDRDDVQISNSEVNCPPIGFPCTFDEYIDNAAKGTSYGLEAQINAQLNPVVNVYGSVGLLESEFEDYTSFTHVDADPENNIGVDLDGHDLPQAPNYTATIGTEIALTEQVTLDLNLVAKDAFFYSNDHEYTSDAYELINARLTYQGDQWQVGLWGRNLTDEQYTVRGFGTFPNDPRTFYAENELYVQYGEPRILGLSVQYQFN